MIKKSVSVILIITLILAVMTACSEKDKTGKVISVPVTYMPKTFDPQIASTVSEKEIAVNCFDMLFKLDEDGQVQKNTCEDYTVSDDGLTYTFKIKKGLKYYVSGKASAFLEDDEEKSEFVCDAYDYAFGITRAILPETEAEDFNLLSSIKNAQAIHDGEMDKSKLGIKVVDANTLKIVLEKKDNDFIYALTQAVSAPCDQDFFEATSGRYGLDIKYIISNGMFYLSYIADDSYAKISKNEEYSSADPAIPSAVVFYLNSDSKTIASKLKKGDYDVAFLSKALAEETGPDTNKLYFENITYAMVFNMSKETLQNEKLRKGLFGCINKSDLAGETANSLIAPFYLVNGKAYDSSSAKGVNYDIKAARANMVAAYEELEINAMSIDILCTDQTQNIAKSIVSNWQKNIGVELNGTVKVSEDFDKDISEGNYDIVIYPLSKDTNKASEFLAVFRSESEDNIFGLESEDYDKLYDKMSESVNNKKVTTAENYLTQNAIVLPLYYESTCFASAESVEGIYFVGNMSNVYFGKGMKE